MENKKENSFIQHLCTGFLAGGVTALLLILAWKFIPLFETTYSEIFLSFGGIFLLAIVPYFIRKN